MASDQGWRVMECALMKMYAECLQVTGDTAGHINILLKLLLHRREISSSEGEKYMCDLEQDLVQFKKRIPPDNILISALHRPLRDFFTLQIGARAVHRENQDGFAIKLYVTNLLPRPIVADIKVKITPTISGQELCFTNNTIELNPGKNEIWTTCNTTAPGVYIFERAVVEWYSMVFEQEFIEAGRKQYLGLYPHGNALRVGAGMAGESMVFVLCADCSSFG
jgi:hypothetical protein